MSITEVEARVEKALETLNAGGLYDFRPTHFNHEAARRLKNIIQLFSSGVVDEAAMKASIRDLCDASRMAYIDFHIRVPEPGVKDFQRLALLFGREYGARLIPPRDAETRKLDFTTKVIIAVGLVMACKQPMTEKLKQQFSSLVVNTKDKSGELLAVIHDYENYNEHRKKLTPAPEVELKYDVAPQSADVPDEIAFTPEALDNESFEQRLPPAKPKKNLEPGHLRNITHRQFEEEFLGQDTREEPMPLGVMTANGEVKVYNPENIVVAREGLPVHEEFRDFCEQLYERRHTS